MTTNWQFFIDTGGTFTDCVAVDPQGQKHHHKVLSSSALRTRISKKISDREYDIAFSSPWVNGFFDGFALRVLGQADSVLIESSENHCLRLSGSYSLKAGQYVELKSPEEAPVLAMRLILQEPCRSMLPPLSLRLATTRGTNALLENQTPDVLLVTTQGFGDVLEIGTGQRLNLFDLAVQKHRSVKHQVLEIPGRLDAQGNEVQPLDLSVCQKQLENFRAQGFDTVALCLMNSYANDAHEIKCETWLRDHGFQNIHRSSHVAPFIHFYNRVQTTVINAALAPIIDHYLNNIQKALSPESSFHVMTSSGSLVKAQHFSAKDSLLSGPAGGVVGVAAASQDLSISQSIGFDMGGTSCDVTRYDGRFELIDPHQVGHHTLAAPAMAIETIAAGGGSCCDFDGFQAKVGPESAGAHPGPACYGAGGPLTLTDVNLLMGRLQGDLWTVPISHQAAKEQSDLLKNKMQKAGQQFSNDEEMWEGFLKIANENMAAAIARISLQKGYDPKEYILTAFGGAGGQQACEVAELLGIRQVLIPEDAGLLSARGLAHARLARTVKKQVLKNWDAIKNQLPAHFKAIEQEAASSLAHEAIDSTQITVDRRELQMALPGQDYSLTVSMAEQDQPLASFFKAYHQQFGIHLSPDTVIKVQALSVTVLGPSAPSREHAKHEGLQGQAIEHRKVWVEHAWQNIPVWLRSGIKVGDRISGPCLILESHCSSYVPIGWQCEKKNNGALLLTFHPNHESSFAHPQQAEPEAISLQLFSNRFRQIAEQMGDTLRRTTLSTNIRERLDFSCALFDHHGFMIVNAPHIPVHLGALGECVRTVMKHHSFQNGDTLVTNHPAFGGSHLPDITLITAVHDEQDQLFAFVASRAHHAEIGGICPGSMPPQAQQLHEEGVIIPPTLLRSQHGDRWDEIRRILEGASYPTRALDDNVSDLKAALNANLRGAQALRQLAKAHGSDQVMAQMLAIKDHARDALTKVWKNYEGQVFQAREHLDDGSPLKIQITVKNQRAHFDFSGSAAQHPGNLNATPAVVKSAVIYVLRLLTTEHLPLNEGLLDTIDLTLPPGMLNPDFSSEPAPAVVGGNVESSQRVVDTLLKAFGLAAASQGTMNNVLFGNSDFSYYETVGGGSGATPQADGASAVQCHMTNTRITDSEILEHLYPVRVEQFKIRTDSGGDGHHQGGDGLCRQLKFLKDAELSILAQRRQSGPYGLSGGDDGQAGKQSVITAGGEVRDLSPNQSVNLQKGDRLLLETPGGGGYGKKRP